MKNRIPIGLWFLHFAACLMLGHFVASGQTTVTWVTNLSLLPALPPVTPRQVVAVGNEVAGWSLWHWNAASTDSTNTTSVVKYTGLTAGRWIKSPLAGNATGITLSGETSFDGSDENDVSATGDYVLGLNYSVTKPTLRVTARSFQTVYDLTNSAPSAVSLYGVVEVMGYYAAGDGGGGKYRKVSASGLTVDGGDVLPSTSASFVWRAIWDGPIDIRRYGAKAGDTTEDSTTAQAAIDFAEASGINHVIIPTGLWLDMQIVVRTATVEGLRPNHTFASTNTTTILLQKESPTDATVSVRKGTGVNSAITPVLRNLFVMGRGSPTTPNKKAITAVDSKYVFRISTNDSPTVFAVTDYPAQVALFYTDTTNFLGSGFVSGITNSGAEAIVTMVPERSLWASTSGSTNGWLTTLNKVVFAPSRTVFGTDYPDPASAGYAAVMLEPDTYGVIVENVTVDKHHVGFQTQNSGGGAGITWLGRNQASHNEFAGFASAFSGEGADFNSLGMLAAGGAYVAPTYGFVTYPTETNSITWPLFRNTAWGFYNFMALGVVQEIATDQNVGSYFSAREYGSVVDYFLADNVIRSGLVLKSGAYPFVNTPGLVINNLLTRTYISANTNVAALIDKNAIEVSGTSITNNLHIGTLSVSGTSGTDDFDTLFQISGISGHSVSIGKKITLDGVDSLGTYATGSVRWLTPSDASSATEQTDLGWRAQDGTYGFAHAGTNELTFGPSGFSFYNSIISNVRQVPTSDGTNVFNVSTSSGQTRMRVDTTNGRVYAIGPDGEGSDPSYNAGTALAVKNNASAGNRARIAVVGGSTGFSTIEMGDTLQAQLQYDDSLDVITFINNSAAMKIDGGGRVSIGSSVADSASSLDLQSTARPLRITRQTAAQVAANGSVADGFITYQTDGTEGFYGSNGSAFARLAWASEITGGTTFTNLSQTDANTVEEKNSTSQQVFNLYGTYTDASNYERLKVTQQTYSSGDYFTFTAEEAGTGTDRQNIVIQPKGGSITAQMPDGTTTGGNVRGIGAVDLQMSRAAAGNVASGANSGLVSGADNTASGIQSVVSGGLGNTASGQRAFVGGGAYNTVSQVDSSVLGGQGNAVSGIFAVVSGGSYNTASGSYSSVTGGGSSTASSDYAEASGASAVANKYGQSSRGSVSGGHQREEYTAFLATTDATASELRLDGTLASANRLALGNNETWGFTITVTGRTSTAGANVYNTVIQGCITKGTTAGSTAIVGTNVVLATQNTAGAAAWAVTATADTTNGALAITVTGAAATNINWHADVRVNKVTKS